ncbi:hypothetical protein ACFYWX_46295 [Streptomyces sp. NPDC002888]|uniref:hypothetical protein n=1 Tax=Streptomyces sp. NPDC002888 TaxID=3364668 RepID=UPI0036A5D89E
MTCSDLRSLIVQARRLIADLLDIPAHRRRTEHRLAAWNEPFDEFLETTGVVLALAMWRVQRDRGGPPDPEASTAFWHTELRALAPDAASEELFAGLPEDLDADTRRQIQALRLASVGVTSASCLRWARLVGTARDVVEHQI